MVQRMSLEEWEEANLENHSYYDIDILEKANKPILKKIKYWEEEFKPYFFIGRWWASLQIKRLRNKLNHYK